jgi:hypothetical protein
MILPDLPLDDEFAVDRPMNGNRLEFCRVEIIVAFSPAGR